jgi:predicted O-methyltransferase YrrM
MTMNAHEKVTNKSKKPTFSQDWFSRSIPCWEALLGRMTQGGQPLRILEVGVFEGRSTCWLLEHFCRAADSHITVIDTFEGGVEHQGLDLTTLRALFEANIATVESSAVVEILQGYSSRELANLIASGAGNPGYDFISVDASHQAPDVLADCVLSFQLLKRGGVMALDDYLWSAEQLGREDLLNSPKIAIDAFTNIFRRQVRVIPNLPLYQLYVQKI